MPEPRLPRAHAQHLLDNQIITCGCTTPDKATFICKCGACYDDEVLSFNIWRCYDCNRSWISSQAELQLAVMGKGK